MTTPQYTVNIQKGGALLPDVRRLVELWQPDLSSDANLKRVADANLLGKATRRRLDDVLLRILAPRVVAPGPQVMISLRAMSDDERPFLEAVYYETSRDEAVLAAFAEGPCFDWYHAGRARVAVDDATAWLAEQATAGVLPTWSPIVRTKVGRGILAALRDFGVLEGSSVKSFASPQLSTRGFTYVAFRLHEQGSSSTDLIGNAVWRRWLLGKDRVEDLFHQASRAGVLTFASAGSAVRVDWHVDSLEDAVRVFA